VNTGLRMLKELADFGGPVTLTALANKLEMSPSQAHRYLASLIASGVARQDPDTGRYDLGVGAMKLGFAALSRIDLFHEADNVFWALARETGRTLTASVWGSWGPTIVRWYSGNPPVVAPLQIGSALPIVQSAAGHIFLAFGHQPTVNAAAAKEIRDTNANVDLDGIRRLVKQEKTATADSTLMPGLRAVSAPIFDLQGSLVLVVTAIMLASATDEATRVATAQLLQTACRKVTEAIGGAW
jgi:DNA-binding IclR family transcriptional regulator